MIVTMPMVIVVVVIVAVVIVVMVVGVVITSVVVVRGDGVRNEMEEGITQEATGSKAEQDFEEGLVVFGILKRDAEEDEERSCTDQGRGDKGVSPQLPGALERG